MSPFITPKEMAERLGVSVSTVYAYLRAGVVPADHVGDKPLVHRVDFETWLKGGRAACGWLHNRQAEPTKVAIELRVNGKEVAG